MALATSPALIVFTSIGFLLALCELAHCLFYPKENEQPQSLVNEDKSEWVLG
jgi:hypothetical protein